jgi:hypothetical protein
MGRGKKASTRPVFGGASAASVRLAEAATERPPALSGQLARFEPYNADEQFANGRIGNLREVREPESESS